MSRLYFLSCLLLAMGIIFNGCSKQTGKNELTGDTIVQIKDLSREWLEKEFFVTTGKDTSAYSFIFSSIDKKHVCLEIKSSIYDKMFYDYITESTDTSAFIKESCRKPRYTLRNYHQMLDELSLCLFTASKIYNMDSLSTIMLLSPCLQEISVEISEQLLGKERYSGDMITSLLKGTSFPKDLDTILKHYNLYVKDARCYNKVLVISDKSIMREILYKDLAPSIIADFPIRISLKNKRH